MSTTEENNNNVEGNPETVNLCGHEINKCFGYILFGIAAIAGIFFTISSLIPGIVTGNAISVVFIIIGNLLVVVSPIFLHGVDGLIGKMKDPSRITISSLYVISIIFNVIAIIFFKMFLKIIALIVMEVLLVLYVLSYFPAVYESLKNCFNKNDEKSAPIV